MNRRNLCLLLFILPLLLLGSLISCAQPLGNEWIDYSKTYYKIPITTIAAPGVAAGNHLEKGDYNRLYRITYSILDSLNLANVPAENFQIWRNGVEVPLYITKSSGLLSYTDYIEFWGEANDGKIDNQLFRDPSYQKNDRWSMYSDTAIHFLTVNTGDKNARITDTITNPLASNLTPEAYFMHTLRINPRQYRYLGYAVEIDGQNVRSSSFDMGEGWGAQIYRNTGSLDFFLSQTPLNEYKNGPPITLKYVLSGESDQSRDIAVSFYNTYDPLAVKDSVVDTKTFKRQTPVEFTVNNIPYSRIINTKPNPYSNAIRFRFVKGPYDNGDRLYVLKTEVTYARTFNFSKTASTSESYFLFSLPATATGDLFDVTAPGIGSFLPYIIDLTNKKRYTSVKKSAPENTYVFELGPSATDRKLLFVSGSTKGVHYNEVIDTSSTNAVKKPSSIKFHDYSVPSEQSDYAIISNSRLFDTDGVNYVDKYREYRASPDGGAFNAKIFDIDSLTDQFAFGIRKNPLAIKNFVRFAKARFNSQLKNVFIIGRGVTYNVYSNQSLGLGGGGNIVSDPTLEALNLVPTWGNPASDNMLVAADNNKSSTPTVPIGRLAAINGYEIQNYLDKVKEYERLQSTPEGATWQKNAIHLIGGSSTNIVDIVKSYMDRYKTILEDTLAGAKVTTYVRVNDPNTAANNAAIQQRVSEGTGLVTYYGHSSPTTIDFSLNDPNELSNTGGKYPVFLFNGCNASEFFTWSGPRLAGNGLTLSEKFVLAKEKGNIAFMSSSHFGILQYLNLLTTEWYKSAATSKYGKGLGEILQNAIGSCNSIYGTSDYYSRVTTEEFILQADPAVKLYSILKPDYEIDTTNISFSPAHVTMATDSITINTTILNHGKAVGDSVWFHLTRQLPDGTVLQVFKVRIPGFGYSKTISIKVPIVGVNEKGQNHFRAVVDSLNLIEEVVETNNSAIKPLFIYDNEVMPIAPYQFSIVSSLQEPVKFIGSTVNPLAEVISYRLQIDTTTAFNSPLLQSRDTTVKGGLVQFNHQLTGIPDKTVCYWRLSPITAGIASNWTNSSFTYLSGSGDGFDQSHYYQHLQSTYTHIEIDPVSRQLYFDSTHNHIYIDQGIYRTSGTESAQFSLAANGALISQGACLGQSIIFNVFDSLSFKPWQNTPAPNGRFGSTSSNCYIDMQYNFEFNYYPASNRKKIMDFLDSIPKGMFVAARLNIDPDPGQPGFPVGKADSSYAKYWERDTAIFGNGKSLYHALLKQGFYGVNELDTPRVFGFVFKKDDTLSFKPQYKLSDGFYDRVNLGVPIPMQDTGGVILSPLLGPATKWRELHWRNKPIASPVFDDGQSDSVKIIIYGVDTAGVEKVLKEIPKAVKDTSIEDIDAAKYPYLRLKMINNDPANGTPQQLDYWRLNYTPLPEGAVSPSDYYNFTKNVLTNTYKDTLDKGVDTLFFGVAFKNISNANFKDSISVEVKLTDSIGNVTVMPVNKLKPLLANDTLHLDIEMLTDLMEGAYTLYVNFNPNKAQPEEFINNNFIYKAFYVDASPEGKTDSAVYFDFTRNALTGLYKDTLVIAKDTLHFGIGFKNTSLNVFKDSILATLSIIPDVGTAIDIPSQTLKPLLPGDTLHLNYDSTTATLSEGWHTITATFNAGMRQREKTLENNSFSHRFYMSSGRPPVSFFSFAAVLQGDSVLLNWTTTNEVDYDSYTVEYSNKNQSFGPLGSFQSQHRNTASSYAFTHNNPITDTNFYRIKITRRNGTVLYSEIKYIVITVPPATEFTVQARPNPFHDKLVIYTTNPDNNAVPATLVNALGQIVRRANLQAYTEINTASLAAGTYWLVIHHGKEKMHIRLEKL